MKIVPYNGEFLNHQLRERLAGLHKMLMAAYQAGALMSSATKGFEREVFVNYFLSQLFPQSFRFGSGDVIDQKNQRSGQVDVVIEFPFFPSFPVIVTGPRLYLAESVAAVIEVKSDISSQLKQLQDTSKQLKQLMPRQGGCRGPAIGPEYFSVPLFLVSFQGWKTTESAIREIKNQVVDGVLIVEHGLCCAKDVTQYGFDDEAISARPTKEGVYQDIMEGDSWTSELLTVENDPAVALWLFLSSLHQCLTRIESMTASPFHYFKESDS